MCSNSIIIDKIEEFVKINEEIKKNIKLLHVFRDIDGKINAFLVTNEDKVYCFGSNYWGILGFGHDNNVKEFTINKDLSNKSIIDFKSSVCHTIARDSNGKLYCWGTNILVGNGRGDRKISKPELNKFLKNENIIDMCCGGYHTLVLTSNNEVFGWGRNHLGQIGNTSSDVNKFVLLPLKLNEFNGEKVKAISCGSEHSMALTESGCVYSWGDNRWGELGLNSDNRNENKPKLIQIEVKIKKISCGHWHSLLLSREGDIYVFGDNRSKQLGVETKRWRQLTPIKLNHSEKFIQITSHFNRDFSAALSENGLYYVWGEYGEEGIISEPKETQFKSFEEIFAITPYSTGFFQNLKYINNWTEIRKLGSGGYGTVFEVQNKLNGNKTFAMKKIPLSDGKFSIEEDSFKELSTIMSVNILKHNNEFLVKYYDSWAEVYFKPINGIRKYHNNSAVYIQMDLCDKTLSAFNEDMKKDSKLFSNDLLTLLGYYLLSEIFFEILKGLKYLHNNNIIHRDLNPHNILVKKESNGNCIKIADFGLAKFFDENRLNTGDIGNITYSAPEVLDYEYYDTKADIYSLGVVLQELFGIEFGKVYNNNIRPKYECLEELHKSMTHETDPQKRPNCDQILDERQNWAINESEFNFEEELNLLKGINEENRSYVQNIIVLKLSHFSYYNIDMKLD